MSTSVPSPEEGRRPKPSASLEPPGQQPAPAAKDAPQPRGKVRDRDDSFHDAAFAHLPELKVSDLHFRPQRRTMLPIVLFLATCASTFWVGASEWQPLDESYMGTYAAMWHTIRVNWPTGLQYMVAVLAILLTHEMGHFLQTVKYRIPASYPLCIPIPFNAIGTMGAVIGMDGMRADRRQIFDIGIAGPLAGLVVAVPVLWWGIQDLDLTRVPGPDEFQLSLPWIGRWMLERAHPQWAGRDWIGLSQLNPYFMAGWVGMLITGLNMLPISQLDGGPHHLRPVPKAGSRVGALVCVAHDFLCRDQSQPCRDVDPHARAGDSHGNPPSAHGQRSRRTRPGSLGHRLGVASDSAAVLPHRRLPIRNDSKTTSVFSDPLILLPSQRGEVAGRSYF